MDFEYNKDQKKRDSHLIFTGMGSSDIKYFSKLNVKELQYLLDNGFADPDECQNSAPSVGEIYEFMKAYPEFTAHGYAVSLERDDYRITLEGVQAIPQSTEAMYEFVKMFREADEFEFGSNGCHCRYD